ncbi:hypothetical protein G6F57_020032 [Rhizopus arrhizus]|nr:hypothetical protein G6F57_020032 [Rhizopus arrhizus]
MRPSSWPRHHQRAVADRAVEGHYAVQVVAQLGQWHVRRNGPDRIAVQQLLEVRRAGVLRADRFHRMHARVVDDLQLLLERAGVAQGVHLHRDRLLRACHFAREGGQGCEQQQDEACGSTDRGFHQEILPGFKRWWSRRVSWPM